MKKTEKPSERVAAQNRAASYDYHLLENFEAGLVLLGTEVKSLRSGKVSLREAYAVVRGREAWLINCHIPEYQPGGSANHAPLRPRKLLLHSREIDKLAGKTQEKGLTLVPLRIYFKDGMAKCEVALARGKKYHDRRESERTKEAKREAKDAIYHSKRR
jgi:SsrA-binding protein